MPKSVEAAIERIRGELPGKQAWLARVGHGSFVTLDIGGVYINSCGSRGGQFHLWVYGAIWTVEEHGQMLAHSESRRRVMEDAVRKLAHRPISSISIEGSPPELTLEFEGGLVLRVTALNEPDMEEWMLFFDDGTVLVATPELIIKSSSGS